MHVGRSPQGADIDTYRLDVVIDVAADHARVSAAITQPDCQGTQRLARLEVDRYTHRVAVGRNLGKFSLLQPQPLCGAWIDGQDIVPGHLGDRIGQFLEPAIVGIASVVGCSARVENQIERVTRALSPSGRIDLGQFQVFCQSDTDRR